MELLLAEIDLARYVYPAPRKLFRFRLIQICFPLRAYKMNDVAKHMLFYMKTCFYCAGFAVHIES